MKRLIPFVVITVVALSCSRPASCEPFVMREDSEYGDMYGFDLDLSDSTAGYSLEVYTRLERKPFSAFPEDSLKLFFNWKSPSGTASSVVVALDLSAPAGTSYFSRDYLIPCPRMDIREYGMWNLKIKALGHRESIRGIGVVCRRH